MSDFEFIQNTTKILRCSIYDSDGKTLLDISEAPEIKFGVKYFGQNGGNPLFVKTLVDGISVVSLGILEVTISPSDTDNILGKLQYELRITDSTGAVFVPISGLCTVNPKSI